MSTTSQDMAAGGGGREVGTVASSHRRAAVAAAALLLALACAAAVLAVCSAPAAAFEGWEHSIADQCSSCHAPGVTDATCRGCHNRFTSYPGKTCWSCHAPSADTSTLSTPSSACSQECHLYYPPLKSYVTSFTHGAEPHEGATGWGFECLDCHNTSTLGSVNGSPHHTGQATPAPTCRSCHDGSLSGVTAQVSHGKVACTRCHDGMDIPSVPSACASCHAKKTFGSADCTKCHADMIHNTAPNVGACAACHAGYQKHAGRVACARCHTNSAAAHHGTAKMKARRCGACHTMRHARRRIAVSRCASCHQGNAPASRPRVEHSRRITRTLVCSTCHSKALHASARGARLTCRSCHTARFHRAQPRPGNSVCLRCHGRARRHSVGFACSTCHRRAVHNARPGRLPVRSGA